MKAIRKLSAIFVVLALALAAGCQSTAGDASGASGTSNSSSAGGY